MKRFLGVMVLGLLWCNVGFAKCIVGNCSNGQGTFSYHNGDIYVGEHKDGKKHGQGTYVFNGPKNMFTRSYVYTPGDKYVGEFKNDKKDGYGTYVWIEEEAIYVGEWKDGKRHGQGTFTYNNGDKYVGEHKDNKRHGQGTFTSVSGNGLGALTWVDGTLTWVDGKVEKGIWKNGELQKNNYAKADDVLGEGDLLKLKTQINGCWSLPLGLPYDEDLLVRINLQLKPDGTVINTEILDHHNSRKSFYSFLADSLLRAIEECQPLIVPTTSYERWKDLQYNFDVKEMFVGL